MEQTSYRLVTEKYDQQQPGLPIVTLWDNVQQGVGLCYFSQTIWLITVWQLSCCGSHGYQDWADSKLKSAGDVLEIGVRVRAERISQNVSNLPPSCCRYSFVLSWHLTHTTPFLHRMTDRSGGLHVCGQTSPALFREVSGLFLCWSNVYVEGLFNEDYWARLFQCGPSPLLVIRGFYFGSVNWYVISYSYYFEYFSELLLAVTFWSLVCCKKEKKTINF